MTVRVPPLQDSGDALRPMSNEVAIGGGQLLSQISERDDREKEHLSHRSASSDDNARVQLDNGQFVDLRTKAEKMHLTEKVAEKKMGVTVDELQVDKAMQILGTKYSRWAQDRERMGEEEQEPSNSGTSFKARTDIHHQFPVVVNEKVYPTKALKTFGVTYDDMVRHKALKVLGVTEEDVANAYRGNLALGGNSGMTRFLPSGLFKGNSTTSTEPLLPSHPHAEALKHRRVSLKAMRTSQRSSLPGISDQTQGRVGFGRAHVHPEGLKPIVRTSKRKVSEKVRKSERRQSRWTLDAETIDGDEQTRIIF